MQLHYLTLGAAIVLEVIATSALKASDGFTRWVPTAIMAGGYLASFYLLSLTLRTMATGIVYAIWSGCGIVLIIAGGLVINLGSSSVTH